ncbi:MAG: triose-phosphate isomerase [Anaerolineales bacterium]|nr:triose-phosphate isomerase [Anaerolineales bacterium]
MRKACVAGNWKMNKTVEESIVLVNELLPGLEGIDAVDSVICPTFTALAKVADLLKGSSILLGAQNLFWEAQGAYTGEIAPQMVAELAEYVILGHSERRAYFHDSDEAVNKKVLAALAAGLKPILCVGETLEENESGKTGDVVKRQLTAGLKDVSKDDIGNMMIAYEPVWAIGTGKAATAEGANQIIKDFIRDELAKLASPEAAENIRILYGGSVKPENAREYFQQPDIDGALVGGASLKAEAFIQITEAAA